MLTLEEIKKTGSPEIARELSKSRHEMIKIKLKLIDQSSKEIHKYKLLKKYIAQLETSLTSTKSK